MDADSQADAASELRRSRECARIDVLAVRLKFYRAALCRRGPFVPEIPEYAELLAAIHDLTGIDAVAAAAADIEREITAFDPPEAQLLPPVRRILGSDDPVILGLAALDALGSGRV